MQWAGCKIIFFDAGVYLVTNTITIPAGTQIVGEAWSTILGTGSAFADYNNRAWIWVPHLISRAVMLTLITSGSSAQPVPSSVRAPPARRASSRSRT